MNKQEIRLAQLVNSDNENVGIVKTDLTDSEISAAIEMFDPELHPNMDVFEKLEMYIGIKNKPGIAERVYLEIVNVGV